MYSPKIADEHIPELYRIAKGRGIHMTRLVNELIEKALSDIRKNNSQEADIREAYHEENKRSVEAGV